jgi:hypothetical protein
MVSMLLNVIWPPVMLEVDSEDVLGGFGDSSIEREAGERRRMVGM